ncbi:WD40-repeat-containing domain protein [Gilbertella persicaria]|uniref:WD40-repeat-containing domain protein n=1 Tax=Gilbertella persicaria TaxID=101096 RepID=UPI00221F9DFC|nr:WD40-repeat-containing domain protein [Gilbertella persicaria]KAI8078938.1 WD40-repeat-containing domain protein [Gilbertella persicaria]
MVLQVTTANNVKVYTVSGGLGSRSIPDWLVRQKKKALKKDFDFRTRVELIQDFEFPEASNRIKTTRDGKYVVATGTYKPQMRVFEFADMSMKFERHTDAETINFEILSDDWTKQALLQNDRSVELHAQGGIHYRTRIPKFGRDLAYHFPSCDLLLSASGSEIYRLNLDQGRFLNSIQTDAEEGVNCVEINPAHQLFGMGTARGTVELWDPRSKSRVGLLSNLEVPAAYGRDDNTVLEVSALKFRHDGLTMGVGTTTGHTLLYDLRSNVPTLVKDHQYGFPIKTIHFHRGTVAGASDSETGGDKVIVADCKIVKIWNRSTGKHFTSIEPETDINDVSLVEDSGLIFTANEGIQMGSYFIPQLGPAPRWASFLENLTEEMEENPNRDVYDEYKFITRKELTALGLEHLLGTNVIKAYMHGFFVDLRLYEKARLIANPFAYDDYRERAVKEKIEKERGSRIRAVKQLPSVNKALAKQLMAEQEGGKKAKTDKTELLGDSRFADLFADPDFQVDEGSKEYQLLHPQVKQSRHQRSDDEDEEEEEEEEEEQMEQDEDEDMDSDKSEAMSGSDSEDDIVSKIRKERGLEVRDKKKAATSLRTGNKRKPEMRMGTLGGKMTSKNESKKSFGSRLKSDSRKSEGHKMSRTAMGGMEMSFTPQSIKKKNDKNKNRRRA